MGIGSQSIALYREFAARGLFTDIKHVMEIGSQDVSCLGFEPLLQELFRSRGCPLPDYDQLRTFASGSGKALYEALGFTYECIDPDERHGALALDLNFDPVPPENRGRYDFITNHGTTEHLVNQYNAFEVAHDLTRVGGLILHVLPFFNYFNHCLYTYRPEYFRSVAKANEYRLMGLWINIDSTRPSFIPWTDDLLRQLPLAERCNCALAALMQRINDRPFRAPTEVTETDPRSEDDIVKFTFIADGEALNRTIQESIRIIRPQNVAGRNSPTPSPEHTYSLKQLGQEIARRAWRRFGQ